MSNTTAAKPAVSNEATALLSPYGAAKLVNVQLAEAGLKAIPPQMMYNYTTARVNAGKKPLIAFSKETGVDREDLVRWTQAYITKKTTVVVTETPAEA